MTHSIPTHARRPHGRIRFGGRTRNGLVRRRPPTFRPAMVMARLLEMCLLVGIVVVLAASVVRAH
jgi:hypothetical protein